MGKFRSHYELIQMKYLIIPSFHLIEGGGIHLCLQGHNQKDRHFPAVPELW